MSGIDAEKVRARALLLSEGRWRWPEILFWIAAASLFFLFPNKLTLLSEIMILGLLALSIDLVLGFAGIVTLGQAAFFGLGGRYFSTAEFLREGFDLGRETRRWQGAGRCLWGCGVSRFGFGLGRGLSLCLCLSFSFSFGLGFGFGSCLFCFRHWLFWSFDGFDGFGRLGSWNPHSAACRLTGWRGFFVRFGGRFWRGFLLRGGFLASQ